MRTALLSICTQPCNGSGFISKLLLYCLDERVAASVVLRGHSTNHPSRTRAAYKRCAHRHGIVDPGGCRAREVSRHIAGARGLDLEPTDRRLSVRFGSKAAVGLIQAPGLIMTQSRHQRGRQEGVRRYEGATEARSYTPKKLQAQLSVDDWVALVALSLLVLFAYNIGERLSFGSRAVGAVVTALLFATGFAVWSYGLGSAVHDAVAAVSSNTTGG